jgi:uncharacterized protein (DUF58 family)
MMAEFLKGFPLAASALDRFKAAARKRMQTEQLGVHLRRRRGQSLEYLEHRPYEPGDDVRHIDWRASARLPEEGAFLVRTYAAEDRLTLLISIDDRSTMRRRNRVKLKIAAWLAYAIGRASARPGDRVYLHLLFGPARPAVEIRPRSAAKQLADELDGVYNTERLAAEQEILVNSQPVARLLRPTAVWLVITDLYFDEEAGDRLGELLRRAQRMNCLVTLIDIDAWQVERRALLEAGAVKITQPRQHRFTFRDDEARRIDREIERRKQSFIGKARRASFALSVWTQRPEETESSFFKERFEHDGNLRKFFRSK